MGIQTPFGFMFVHAGPPPGGPGGFFGCAGCGRGVAGWGVARSQCQGPASAATCLVLLRLHSEMNGVSTHNFLVHTCRGHAPKPHQPRGGPPPPQVGAAVGLPLSVPAHPLLVSNPLRCFRACLPHLILLGLNIVQPPWFQAARAHLAAEPTAAVAMRAAWPAAWAPAVSVVRVG